MTPKPKYDGGGWAESNFEILYGKPNYLLQIQILHKKVSKVCLKRFFRFEIVQKIRESF